MAEIEIVKVTSTQVSSSTRVLTFQAAGVGAEGDDADAEAWDDCELAQPAGLMARPALASTTECLAIRRGDELLGLVIVDKGAPAQNVETGETRIYGVNGATNDAAVIRIRASGKIEITTETGQDIVLNAGALKVARVTDPVRIGTVTGTAGPYPVVFSTTLVDADGTPGAPTVGNTATLSGVISNAGGATNVKA